MKTQLLIIATIESNPEDFEPGNELELKKQLKDELKKDLEKWIKVKNQGGVEFNGRKISFEIVRPKPEKEEKPPAEIVLDCCSGKFRSTLE